VLKTVLLLRHGETALNRSGALRGHLDVPLSEGGVREARQLAQRVAVEYRLGAIYSSSLLRARSTAEELVRLTGLDVQVDNRFDDVDYGAWAGRGWESFSAEERAEFRRWQRCPEVPLRGAEEPASAQHRALAGLSARATAEQNCVAVVSHDAIIQLLLCAILSIDLQSYRGIVQHTAALNELQRSGDAWRVRLLNSTWHLDGTT
jgi:broad specificity phosphatase PhoE